MKIVCFPHLGYFMNPFNHPAKKTKNKTKTKKNALLPLTSTHSNLKNIQKSSTQKTENLLQLYEDIQNAFFLLGKIHQDIE